jgi:hypothetical protein
VRARAQITIPGRISELESLWYDTSRWPAFVDGFHHVVSRDDAWPAHGTIVWDSTPGGRGRVAEYVQRHEARVGQTVDLEDERITGTQTVSFEARAGDRVLMTLELRYTLKERPLGPLSNLVDVVFIMPRQRDALNRTLARFARELVVEREFREDHA